MPRTRIKICGVRDPETALVAAESGADAVGFVFVRASPRFIDPAEAFEIMSALPPFVAAVGVFMNHSLEAFSDIGYEVVRQVASGDWVATHFRFSGINRRPFAGVSSPGTRMEVEGMSMNRFLDGKVIEGHVVWDVAGMARQLGGYK